MIQLRIKELCKEKGITLNQLAEKIGISQPSISGIATGKQKPAFDTLEKMADALEVTPAEPFRPSTDEHNHLPALRQTYQGGEGGII